MGTQALSLSLITLVIATNAALANAETSVLGFQVWKNARVEEAKGNLERAQGESKVENKNDRKSAGQRASRNDPKIQQALVNVDVAQELGVNDYFVLYLRQFKSKEAFTEVAKKLTADETADLLIAYQKHLAGPQEAEVVIPSGTQISPSSASLAK